ncbi:MAG TPA: adenosine-specific kinase [Spirochaetota bacterium]|nr:adenosine-specific kinase [Spirochaetota bacterium]HOS33934.1 adenosine-specific kinase [Spirochaetota bacterium]HOS56891.1 adenosine-specific kinase [Spirochaetota bacterium]HQF79111.1 adenosine-specific kinase [Spirochaetota bacterium]HQH31817.1 adenosine-specific kinase [Spirochaetota bacterium]
MNVKEYRIDLGEDINIILGQSHFIKTVSDLAEIIPTTTIGAQFAVAFNEASGPCLIRYEGNDEDLTKKAIEIMQNLKAGHTFVILLKNCYPINILSKVKMCDEVVRIFCASANPLTVFTAESNGGAAIVGVVDGLSPKGVEQTEDKIKRAEFLKKIGYKY